MKKFIVGPESIMKNVLISDTDIKLSDEDYKTEEAFLEKLENGIKGSLDTEFQIKYEDVAKIILDEPDMGIQLFFSDNGKSEKTYIELQSKAAYIEIRDFIIARTGFSKTEEQVGSFMVWAKSGLYTIAAAIFGIATYLMAVSLESGDEVTVSGRRKGMKKLLVWLAEALGSTGVLILFGMITVALIFRTYKSFNNSKKGMIVYRKV